MEGGNWVLVLAIGLRVIEEGVERGRLGMAFGGGRERSVECKEEREEEVGERETEEFGLEEKGCRSCYKLSHFPMKSNPHPFIV
ncbi:hypothetical protein Hanom_Chr04g00357971 [Helianthus anomalus]